MPLDIDSALGISQYALKVRSRRAELIANNLANQDTPNFKARDLDFREMLTQAKRIKDGEGLMKTDDRHLDTWQGLSNYELKYRIPNQPSVDGNTVDSQMEASAYMENTLRYQASLEFLSGTIRSIRKAIKGE